MSLTSITLEGDVAATHYAASESRAWSEVLADYVELTKPKIATMSLVTLSVAAVVANDGLLPWALFLHLIVGTWLVAASASALNQWLESEIDGRMARTLSRPLPAGRLTHHQVASFAGVTIVLGLWYLATCVNPQTAFLGFATWLLYAWIYTPLKTRTPLNTAVGAVPGALPVLMGWTAVRPIEDFTPMHIAVPLTLFLIVYLWQFPHFMAIAWLYRRQYGEAGFRMLPSVDPSGLRTSGQAMIGALLLIPVSVAPVVLGVASPWFAVLALVLSTVQFGCAVRFFRDLNDVSARRLLRASLLYLPMVFLLLFLGPLVG